MEQRGIERTLSLYPWQKLYFSYFCYGDLYPLFNKELPSLSLDSLSKQKFNIMLLTGIASPQQLEYDIRKYAEFKPLHFSDHHNFSTKDFKLIEDTFDSLPKENRIVITTEKDSARLYAGGLKEEIAKAMYVLPIEVDFMNDKAEEFNQIITGYVHKNSRNSTLLKE